MFKPTLVFAICLCLAASSFAADKPKEWNTGHVIQFDKNHWTSTGGSTTDGKVNKDGTFHANTNQTSWGHDTYYLTLDAGDYIYYASRTLSLRWQKDPQITENADIKWRLDGNNLILLGEKGKEFKMKLEKKRKK